ncbi:MAG: hypothetical protein LQ346_003938 [Caloplaca aetnensis]|nr:MAG: hypothetical protein LQ346_003938 [Caloplaca aetnensis]
MHRLPAEIRNQIYELALASNVTYHLEDMLAPARYDDDCEEDDEAEELDADDYRPHYQFRCMIEKDIKGFYQNGRSHKLRAISLSSECRHPVGLLQTCSLIYHEASSIFYSRNRFLIHSRWANWTSVNHFLDLLRPETRRCIQSLGVLRLRPTVHSNPKPRGHHSRQSALYYSSMKTFLDDFIPQLSLRSLLVHVNLIDLYYEPNHELSYSPQAPWLNAFLRLPFDTIDIRVEYEGFDINIDNLHDTPGRRLVDRVNAIDFRTRLRAKWLHHDGDYNGVPLWWTDVPVDERVGRRDAMEIYKSKLGAYSMLDIWAQCATDASKGVMAEASNPYEDGADEICV